MGEAIISRSSANKNLNNDSGGKLINEIILSNMNWKVPVAKDQKFRVILFGGGEAGGWYVGNNGSGGSGGNGGCMNFGDIILQAGSIIPITIGEGGTPIKNGNKSSPCRYGEKSSFGTYYVANGGSNLGGGSGGGGGGWRIDGGNAFQFGGGGGGNVSYGGNGGIWGGGGASSNYPGNGGTYGGVGGSWSNNCTAGSELNRDSRNLILLEYDEYGSSGSYSNDGGGGFGSCGGKSNFSRYGCGSGGGGGGYGPSARGGNGLSYEYEDGCGGGGGGFFAPGGNGGYNGGGGGGGCGAFGLNGKGGDGMGWYISRVSISSTSSAYPDIYIKAGDGGIAAGGGGAIECNTNNISTSEIQAMPGNGGNGVCIIQYYI